MSSTSPPSLPQTFQLPDTLNIIASLDLSANQHCRAASNASATFTSTIGLPDLNLVLIPPPENNTKKENDDEEDKLKLGLLTSLIFPRADLPQLVLLIDFLQMLVWSCIAGSVSTESRGATKPTGQTGLDVLESHPYLKHCLPRLRRYPRSSSPTWMKSFEDSFTRFCGAQDTIHSLVENHKPGGKMKQWIEARSQSSKPRIGVSKPNSSKDRDDELDAHLNFRRNMYGSEILMLVAELLEVIPAFDQLSEDLIHGGEYKEKRGDGILLSDAEMKLVNTTKENALDFLGMAMDALSFRYLHLTKLPPRSSSSSPVQEGGPTTMDINPYLPYTFIPYVMMHKSLSLQGAMNRSLAILTEEFNRFKEARDETKVSELVEQESLRVRRVKSGGEPGGWGIGERVIGVMRLLGGSTSANDLSGDECDYAEGSDEGALHQYYLSPQARIRRKSQIKASARALEDVIVGSVNWAYESELLFGGGNKGTEVRAFGWVFG